MASAKSRKRQLKISENKIMKAKAAKIESGISESSVAGSGAGVAIMKWQSINGVINNQ
jgi:hypothetical protein